MYTMMRNSPIHALGSLAMLLALAAPFHSVFAADAVITEFIQKVPSATKPVDALIPICTPDTAGAGDGVPTVPKYPDGTTELTISSTGLTTRDQPDLAISAVNATRSLDLYGLTYCVINRGGQTAFSPIVVAVVAGDATLQEVTLFRPLPPLTARCFGTGTDTAIPAQVKLAGATIEVGAATGETSKGNNKCRISWISSI